MNQFYLDIEASSSYGTTAPTLEILVGGAVVGSASINSSGTFSFLLDYPSMDTFPSALSLRFNDGSGEAGRTITIANVRVNGQLVASSSISQSVLNQNDSSTLNTSAEDHLFGRVDPSSPDLGTVTISGTGGADNLQATNGDDVIDGAAGNDRIRGVYGDDAINGGAGDDTIFGEDGNDIILGGTGADLIFGNNGNDLLFGQDDNDRLMGGNGNDTLNGGAGNDLLMGGNDDDILYGEAGVDRLIGQNGDDILYGDAGSDTLSGGNGNDTLYGGSGDDYLIGGTGADTLNGGDDDDFILGNTGADILNGDAGNDYIYGGADNDTLNGGADNDALHGDAGNDTLNGDAGNDTLIGGFGADTLNGGTGNDILHGHGLDAMAVSAILNANANVVYSEDTNSFYQLVSTSVTLAGAQGVSGASSLNGVAGHLVTVTSQTENDFVDTLADGNQVWLNGSDSVVEGEWRWAGGNEDNLMFWNGNNAGALENGLYENWNAGEPNDSAGEDGMVMIANGSWNDLSVTSTNFYVIEWDGADFSDDNAIDTLSGDDGNDYLNGHGGNDILSGGNGVDHIVGGAGNDTLNGNSDNDYLYDSLGNNTFNGGTGDDILDARFQTAIPSIADQIATILSENPAVSYSVDTGNFYEVVSSQVDWDIARVNAANVTFNGIGGHLATITTQEEHDFIVTLAIGQNTWLGGSDDPTITGGAFDEWYWVEGPDAGTHFSTDGTAEAGQFTDWNPGQPNDTNDTQNYLYLLNANNGWADLVIESDGSTGFVTVPQYLVEWEGADVLFAPPTEVSQGINIMNGGSGDDAIYGSNNNDIINGDDDNDTIYGYVGSDTIDGGSGADEIHGGSGNDIINGGDDNDTLYGDQSEDVQSLDTAGLISYAGSQDGGGSVTQLGNGIELDGNLWKKILVDYTVTANTVIEFDFQSSLEAEISAVGFDNDNTISSPISFKVYGTQNWGISTFDTYDGSGDWAHYVIDVGSFYTGTFTHFFMINDDDGDGGGTDGNSSYANIKIYETGIADADDDLYGGDGSDVLIGGNGADSFVFENTTAFNGVDIVEDFNIGQNDTLDVSDILSSAGYNDATDAITDWLQITDSGFNSEVRIDISGSTNFGVGTQIATLNNIRGLTDETALEASGTLITS